ncbi:uncharacterized protein A1O9_00271 [Exophiala aquamarina CBS 119918]|uniref:Transcription factor domain-containing protein n=1 Tax=Exophiala aquamarina CBS 119918 TaxID=1182545 RepID=A0A072PQF0_9EURO|nr:uncharacterized protein A1O9_00271 [Exophiala aquamarina CBS 119918]KEF62299.1 hypothetical protein A1O9_00271 [Exophiala aquamarina CBS 119918]
MVDDIYSNIKDAEKLVPGQLALFLAILASAAATYQFFFDDVPLDLSISDASQVSLYWTNSALEMLEIARRTCEGVIEDIQATILLSFLLYHLEGFSARVRGLFASATCIARDLSLHRIDVPSSQISDSRSQPDPVSLEMKRRIFWHVVATDWLLSLSGGPQEGTYNMQPRHMIVKRPRNVDDKDLRQNPSLDQPISSPTVMSYYIQRINLADLCRRVADTMPLLNVEVSPINYQDIIALDKRFEAFLEELPTFLKTDEQSRMSSEEVMLKYPQLRAQRYALGMIALTRRCKLHQPFLIRGSINKGYHFSREVSLKSARSVIKLKKSVELEPGSVFASDVKLTGICHHIFMATIVLVTDLCFNRGHGDDEERHYEVVEALKILEEAKSRSRMVGEFVESLEDVLRRHKVHLLNRPHTTNNVGSSNAQMDQPHKDLQTTESIRVNTSNPWETLEDPMSYPSEFDSVWRDYVQLGPVLQMPEWDSLFSDLDNAFN